MCNEKVYIYDFPFKEKNFLYHPCPENTFFFFFIQQLSTHLEYTLMPDDR